jgi:hypothetical protein
MEVQSDRAYYKLADGTMELGRPYHAVVSHSEQTWVELKAKYLGWAMVA